MSLTTFCSSVLKIEASDLSLKAMRLLGGAHVYPIAQATSAKVR